MMFDFQKMDVYQKSKEFYSDTRSIISVTKLDNHLSNQLSGAAFSIAINVAEGTGKCSKADRVNFLIIARTTLFKCVAIMDILCEEGKIKKSLYQSQLTKADELSRILYSMIKNLL